MRKLISSAAVITAAGALLVGGGTFSLFTDSHTTPGSFSTGTVKMAVARGVRGVDLFAVSGACTQHYVDRARPTDRLNLGTVNNVGCTSTFAVHNSGSLPFELSASTLVDSNPTGRICFTTTINNDGFTKQNVVLPGADQQLTVNTITVSDDKRCQTQNDNVTAHLVANEARPMDITLSNGGFETGDLSGWTTTGSGAVSAATSYQGYHAKIGTYFGLVLGGCHTTRLAHPFTAVAGSRITGYSFFKDNDYMPYNDSGSARLIMAGGGADTVLFSSDLASVGEYNGTPWTKWSYVFPATGTYSLAIDSTNDRDCSLPSAIGIDMA